MKKFVKKLRQRFVHTGLAFLLVASSFGTAPLFWAQNSVAAPGINTTGTGFNVLSNWENDRSAPSGGYTLTDSSLTLNVDGSKASTNPFYRTEGRKADLPTGTNSIKATLHVDAAWASVIGVRAGIWAVTTDPSVYPILEFSNRNDADDQLAGTPVIRAWDSATGWTNIINNPTYGTDYTFEIVHNPYDDTFEFYINNSSTPARVVSTVQGGTSHGPLAEVIFNSYNSGITGNNYSVVWSNFQIGKKAPGVPADPKFFKGSTEIAAGSTLSETFGVNNIEFKWNSNGTDAYRTEITYPDGTTKTEWTSTRNLWIGETPYLNNEFGQKGDGTYSYRVQARSATNSLWSGWTTPIALTYDSQRPTVELLAPTSYGPVNAKGTTIQVKADDSAAVNKVVANIYKNGNLFKSTQSAAPTNSKTYNHTVNLETVMSGSPLPDGVYTVRYNATDHAGHMSTTHSFTFEIDNSAPATPTNGQPNGTYKNSASGWNYTWSDESASGAVRYEYQASQNSILVDGALVNGVWNSEANGSSSQKTALMTGPSIPSEGTSDGTWYWQVRSVDAAGNRSPWSSVWSVTVDTKAPAAPQIISPSNGQYFNHTPILNQWTAVTDPSGIAKYQVAYRYDDGHTFSGSDCPGETIGGQTLSGCRDVTTGTSRNHAPNSNEQGGVTIWVRAQDNSGNWSSWSAPVHYYYDATAPAAPTLVSPANNSIIRGASITQSWSSTSNDVHHYVYESYHDAAATSLRWHEEFTATSKTATNVADSTYWWRVKAVDHAGNESGWSELWKVTVDNTAPDVTINSYGQSGNVIQPDVTATDASPLTYSWTTDPDVDISDTNALNPTFTVNEDGTYSFYLTVTDAAGNSTTVPFSFTYTTPQGGRGGPETEQEGDASTTNVAFINVTTAATGTPAAPVQLTDNGTGATEAEISAATTASDVEGASTDNDDATAGDETDNTANDKGFNWWWIIAAVAVILLIFGWRWSKDETKEST